MKTMNLQLNVTTSRHSSSNSINSNRICRLSIQMNFSKESSNYLCKYPSSACLKWNPNETKNLPKKRKIISLVLLDSTWNTLNSSNRNSNQLIANSMNVNNSGDSSIKKPCKWSWTIRMPRKKKMKPFSNSEETQARRIKILVPSGLAKTPSSNRCRAQQLDALQVVTIKKILTSWKNSNNNWERRKILKWNYKMKWKGWVKPISCSNKLTNEDSKNKMPIDTWNLKFSMKRVKN